MFSDIVHLAQLVQQNLSKETETVDCIINGVVARQRDFIYMPEITSTLRRGMSIWAKPLIPPPVFNLVQFGENNLPN